MNVYDKAFSPIERPFAWIDIDALNQNIDFVNSACGDKKIRIATKSVRSVPILKYIAKRLHHFTGYMTFTASETSYLLEHGLDQLLIGYPVYEPYAITKLADWVKKGKSITFMIDSNDQLKLLNEIAERENVRLSICIDLNVSTNYRLLYFGTKRSPLTTIETLDTLLKQLKNYPQLIVQGVMGYDAQIAGVADQSEQFLGAKGALIRKLKKQSLKKITSFRQFAVAHVKSKYPLKFVNAGGTGSMQLMASQRDVTEVTVGSAFFAPALFDGYDSLQLQPSAGFALRVTRKFTENIVVCHGGGYVASGAVGEDRLPVFLEKGSFRFTNLEGPGEVQTPIIVKKGQVEIGDTIYFRHAKAGELCERFQVLHAVEDGQYVGPIKTYRGDGQCFL
jgi:D-serine deaminase-like pyridoxal phosphate-dependent protein